MKKIYVVQMVVIKNAGFSIEPVGAYSSVKKAIHSLEECEAYITPKQAEYTTFEIVSLELNAPAEFIEWFKKANDVLEKETKSLMDRGYVDQLIGEDGQFYYTLTDKGKKIAKYIQAIVPNIDIDNMDP